MSAVPELPEHQEHPEPDPIEGPAPTEGSARADADAASADEPAAADGGAAADQPGDSQPEARPATDDELFARLIAGFDDPVEAGARTWPEAEDVADLAPAPRPRPSIMQLPVVRALPPVDPRAWSAAEDPDEEHFVPPPPEPLPRPEAPTRLAVAALVLGLILIGLYLTGQLPGLGAVLGGCAFLGGAATLVSRLRVDDDDDDPDPHNGAVV
jgi:hypothetical protein